MPNLQLVGPFPPPFGGVAQHLVRLAEGLRQANVNVQGWSTGGIPVGFSGIRHAGWRTLLQRLPVHLHTDEGNARRTVLLGKAWMAMGRRFALTVHSFRDRPDLAHLDGHLASVFNHANLIITVSDEVRTAVHARLGVPISHMITIPSALPISSWERSFPLPQTIPTQWLDATVRILANAGRVVRYQGTDLYGIDTLISAFTQLSIPQVSLLLVLGQVVDVGLHQELVAMASTDERIHVITGLSSPLANITHRATIVVRPTRTEGGGSLTLAEAIECGVWAVGSDAVPRPEGTVLFQTGNADHLRTVLEHIAHQQAPHPRVVHGNGIQLILDAYRTSGLLPTS